MALVLKRFQSFTCTPTCSSAIGMSHTCLCLSSFSRYSFTDPGGMEGWVGLGGWLCSDGWWKWCAGERWVSKCDIFRIVIYFRAPIKRRHWRDEKIQKRATKLIISLKKLSYKERLLKLKLPTLKYRCMRGDMTEVFKFFYIITMILQLPQN